MPQLGRFDYTVQTALGLAVSGGSVAVYREGATVNGNQSGVTPLAVTVRHAGKIATGDTVFINAATATGYLATRTSATVITLSGFGGTLSLTGGDRLTPSGSQPTLYSDDQGGSSTGNPLTTSSTGRVSCWMEFGAYDLVVSGGGATTTTFTAEVTPTQAPGQVRYADEFKVGSTTGGMQEALNDLPAAGGTIVLSGGATYLPTTAVSLATGITILGNGATIQRSASLDALSIFKDAGSAISNVTIRDIVFDNNSRAATAEDILLTGGCTDVRVEGCRWINLTGRTEDLTRVATSASKGARVSWLNNTVIGPGSQQTYNSFQIFDCDNVDVSGNVIDGWGGVKLEGASAASLFNWLVSRNRFKSVDQSNIFVRTQNASSVRGIVVTDNVIVDCGKAGVACDVVSSGDTGTMTDIVVSNNAINGFGLTQEDDGIQVGGVRSSAQYMTTVSVTGNVIDGLKSDGTFSGSPGRGISAEAGMGDCTISGNTIRNAGRSGIGISSTDTLVCGNTVDRCVRTDTTANPPTPATEGGIAVFDISGWTATDITVCYNRVKNCGVSGAVTSNGISVDANGAGGTVKRVFVYGNRCYDDQGTQTQAYGIVAGALGVAGPNDSLIFENDCRNNKTGGISGPLGTATGIYLRDNVPNDGITKSIGAAATTITPSANRILLTADNNYTLSSTPTISDGFWNGQTIEIMNIDTVDTITLQDQGTLPSSNLRLGAATRALAPRDNITLRYDTTIADWVEIGFVNVT